MMAMNREIELSRSNSTLTAFLASVRYACRQKGIACGIDRAEFENPSAPCHTMYITKDGQRVRWENNQQVPMAWETGAESEICKIMPLDYQIYIKDAEGNVFNEICEFRYDDAEKKIGYGYYYQLNKDVTAAEVESGVATPSDLTTMIKQYVEDARQQLIDAGYGEVKNYTYETNLSKKMTRVLACIRRLPEDFKAFEIRVSVLYARTNPTALKQTIMHELIHSLKGCMNHGIHWQRAAANINAAYGYQIARTSDAGAAYKEAKNEMARYEVVCQGCGAVHKYTKQSKAVKYPELFHCGRCKGKLTSRCIIK